MPLSAPDIAQPVHSGGRAVAVTGHLIGAKVEIFRYPHLGGPPEQIGERTMPNEEVVNITVSRLDYRDRVFAVQSFGGETSDPAPLRSQVPETELPDQPIGAPRIPTLYICGRVIGIGNIVHGAEVTVYVNDRKIFQGPVGYSFLKLDCDPLTDTDTVKAVQSFVDLPTSKEASATAVAYSGPLPPPRIVEPAMECARSFEVADGVPGAQLSIYSGSEQDPVKEVLARVGLGDTRHSIELDPLVYPNGLPDGLRLVAQQELCGAADRSPLSKQIRVEGSHCLDAYRPRLHPPFGPGQDFVIAEGLHEVDMRVMDGSREIGRATCFGVTRIGLTETLAPNAAVHLVHELPCRGTVHTCASVPARAKFQGADIFGEVIELGDANHDMFVNEAPKILVDYWAPWCGPCMAFLPRLEEMAKYYKGRVIIAKCQLQDANRNPVFTPNWLPGCQGATYLPYIVLYKDGAVFYQSNYTEQVARTVDALASA